MTKGLVRGDIPGDFREARGVLPWKPGDERAEETIRRLRDGRPIWVADLLAAAEAALARIESDIESEHTKTREGDMLRNAISKARGER